MKLYALIAAFTVLSTIAGIAGGTYLKNQDAQAAAVAQSEAAEEKQPVIFSLGQMMVPIYRARNVSYVMADVRLSLESERSIEAAERYYDYLRSAALETMVNSAALGRFNDATINQSAIAQDMAESLNEVFEDEVVEEVLFHQLIRQDLS